jgi:hypothetical protein
MKAIRSISLIIIFILIFCSCQQKIHRDIQFYYWKTTVEFGETEKKYFEGLNSQKLYLRYFDVDKTGDNIHPKAKINRFDANEFPAEYVPVVFITNRTFVGSMSEREIRDLAQRVFSLIRQIEAWNNIPGSKEIQIDCDWTKSTRENYFNFLTALKNVARNSGTEITATLRLHQVKFRDDTGIPPVNKVYLMCYATSNPSETSDKNSILDIALLKDYTQNIETYPLDIDIALPLYSWAVVTNHLGKIKLINGVSEQDLASPVFKKIKKNLYEVQEDMFFKGLYINKGFTIRIEGIDNSLLRKAKKYLDKKLNKDYTIVYYHLDEPFLNRFTINQLK